MNFHDAATLSIQTKSVDLLAGTWEPGGPGGPVPPLEFGFYRVKIFKMDKISFSLLFGPPLGKNRSQGPVYMYYQVSIAIAVFFREIFF